MHKPTLASHGLHFGTHHRSAKCLLDLLGETRQRIDVSSMLVVGSRYAGADLATVTFAVSVLHAQGSAAPIMAAIGAFKCKPFFLTKPMRTTRASQSWFLAALATVLFTPLEVSLAFRFIFGEAIGSCGVEHHCALRESDLTAKQQYETIVSGTRQH
jgi:hypothetical protein